MYYTVVTKQKFNRHRFRKQHLNKITETIGDNIMKTQNNNQESSNSQVSKMTLRTSVVLVSVVLISLSVSAQDLWNELSNAMAYGKMTLTLDEQSAETKNADIAIDAITSELTVQLNNNSESFSDLSKESSANVENEMNNDHFISNAELQTAESVDAEIEKYATKLISTEEMEESMTIENKMNMDRFIQEAEQQTAKETDAQIAHYVEKIITIEEAELGLTIDSNKSNDSFFQMAEQYTADGVNAQIAYFAERITNHQEFNPTAAIDNYRLNSEQLCN
jgi:hypothetical protein